MKKVNATFEPIEGVKRALDDWNKNYAKSFRDALLDSENQMFLKELFTSEGEGNILDMVLNMSQSNQNLSQAELFNITETREQLTAYFEGNFRFGLHAILFDKHNSN